MKGYCKYLPFWHHQTVSLHFPCTSVLALLDSVSSASFHGRPSSVNSGFSETAAWIQAKFYVNLPSQHFSRPLFFLLFFFQSFNFQILTIHLQPNFTEGIAWYVGIQALTCGGNGTSIKHFVALWHFSMRVNGKILKCAILWNRLIGEGNGWKFGTRCPRHCIGRILFMILWVQFGVHFAKFPILRFSKGQSYHNFHQFQPNFMEIMVIRGMQAVTFLAIYQISKIYRTLKIVLLTIRLSVFHVAKGQGPWSSCGNCVTQN